jgi:NADH-quinone oxidoreductase subunit F
MELDPHQLIEGVLIAAYAINAAQAFLYVRGEMALAQERIAQALNDAYANNVVGRNILGTDFSVDIVLAWGAGAYIVGEETALIESLEGERGMPRLKPRTSLPRRGCTCSRRGEQRRDAREPAVDHQRERPGVPRHRRAVEHRHADVRRSAATSTSPGVFEVPNGVTTFRMLFDAPEYCGGVRGGPQGEGVHPGGASAPWFFEEHLDLPLDKPTVDKAGSMLGSGAIIVMDETTDTVVRVLEPRALLRSRELRQVHAVSRGHHVAGAILKRIITGHGRPRTSTC